jgi:hypothetical protein
MNITFHSGNLMRRKYLDDVGVDWKIIFKRVLKRNKF